MAERDAPASSPSSDLTVDDIHEVFRNVGPVEAAFMRELLALDNPKEAMTLARILHYFPGARLEPVSREGKPLSDVVQEMFDDPR